MSQIQISDLLSISSAYHTEVNIKRDFNDTRKMEGYVPNEASRLAMAKIFPGLMPTSTKRVHLITGAYGTGKSHFGLVVAALLRQQPKADSVLAKINKKDRDTTEIIRRHLRGSTKFLVVVPEAHMDPAGFNHALLIALEEALTREGIVFRPRSQFKLAIEKIESWRRQGLENQTDAYQKLEKALSTRGTTPDILEDLLRQKFSNEAYSLFEEVHKEIAYGADFLPNASTDPRELYQQTIEHLRSTGEWEGIWIICDEFGYYLTEIAKDPNSRESIHIQEFAEYCKRSDEKQCHFMVIAHQTLVDYAAGYRSQEDWEKISGRFIGGDYALTNIGSQHEVVEIIDTIITRQTQTSTQKDSWQEIIQHPDLPILIDDLQNTKLYSDQKPVWLKNTLILGCFPLHPITTYCLPWLAQQIGQRNRTLFTFFNDTSIGGLRHFVENQSVLNKDRRLNLYTVDLLVTYFGPAAERKPQYRPTIRAREDALELIGDSIIARRIINALTIFEIVGAANLQPTEANLISALHLSPSDALEVKKLMIELTAKRIIRSRNNGFFELRRRKGELDLQDVIRETKNSLRPMFSFLDFLKKMNIKLTPIWATSYEKQHFVKRAAVRDLIVSRSLSNPKEFLDRIGRWYEPNRGKYEGDVLILYVLAEDTTEIEQAKKYVAEKECQHPQLVIAIPKQTTPLNEILLEIAAAQQVKGDLHQSPNKDDADLEELDQIIAEKEMVAGERLGKFLQADNLIWYCGGDMIDNLTKDEEEQYISNLLNRHFSKTPAVKDEMAQILSGKDNQRKYRHYVITELLEQKGYINIKKVGGADQRIFRGCLVDTGILERKQDRGTSSDFEVRSVLPKGTDFEEIWNLARNDLMQQEKLIELGGFIHKLLRPPYGLSHQLIELLLAAFFRNRLDEFVIQQNYQNSLKRRNYKLLNKINLDALTISAIVANPDDYVLMYYEVRPEEREYVSRIITLVASDQDDKGGMGIWERGRDALCDWFTTLPAITIHASLFESEITTKLVNLLKEEANFEDAKGLFRSQLPNTLEVNLAAPPNLDDDEVEALFDKFEQCFIELTNYAEKQALIFIKALAKIFEVDGSTRDDLVNAITNWHKSKLSDSQRFHTFGGDAGHLKKAIEAEGMIDQRMLRDLPNAMGLGAYTSWVEGTQPQLFLTKVQLAKKEIEDWQPKVEDKNSIAFISDPNTAATDEKIVKETVKMRIKAVLEDTRLSNDLKKQILQELLNELP